MKKLTVLLRVCAQVVDRVSGLVIACLLGCLSLNALASITATTEYMYTEVLGDTSHRMGHRQGGVVCKHGSAVERKNEPGVDGLHPVRREQWFLQLL